METSPERSGLEQQHAALVTQLAGLRRRARDSVVYILAGGLAQSSTTTIVATVRSAQARP